MWLLNTHDDKLKEYIGNNTPDYAILSHRWGDPEQEVSWADYKKGRKQETTGYMKIRGILRLAVHKGLSGAWMDTCCIDKKSSAELSEAINSMWDYYANAAVCFVYLDDSGDDWRKSQWFNRGWTLQELLAPSDVRFYDQNWRFIGSRHELAKDIGQYTNIPIECLRNGGSLSDYTVAQKLSWAANRKTTRKEDRAYSLLGLFDINMPLLYGEGEKAFQRLQLAIIERYSDQSIFAWHADFDLFECRSLLASSPDDFDLCNNLALRTNAPSSSAVGSDSPPRATSWGIELNTEAYQLFPRKHIIESVYSEQFLYAMPLTLTQNGRISELPCVLVLTRGGCSPASYQCCGAIYKRKNQALRDLEADFTIGRAQIGTLLYLDYHG